MTEWLVHAEILEHGIKAELWFKIWRDAVPFCRVKINPDASLMVPIQVEPILSPQHHKEEFDAVAMFLLLWKTPDKPEAIENWSNAILQCAEERYSRLNV